jgi:hypothetical protein
MKIAAKMLPHSGKVDISTWSLEAVEDFKAELQKSICAAATEALDLAVKYDASAWFPNVWNFGEEPSDGINGPPPSDPMTIYVTLPLGPVEYEGPTWGFSLSGLVERVIEGKSSPDGKIYIDRDSKCVAEIRDGLRALAQKIDDAIAKDDGDGLKPARSA